MTAALKICGAVFAYNLDKISVRVIITNCDTRTAGRSAVWLAHLLWEQGVGSSNLLAPTRVKVLMSGYAGIAQLARAMAFQAVGRGFESRFPLQKLKS